MMNLWITKNWKCHICSNTSFLRKHDLLTHYQMAHTDEDTPLELVYKTPHIQQLVQDQGTHLSDEDGTSEQDGGKISNRLRKRRKFDENNNLNFLQNEINLEKQLEFGEDGLNLLLNSLEGSTSAFTINVIELSRQRKNMINI